MTLWVLKRICRTNEFSFMKTFWIHVCCLLQSLFQDFCRSLIKYLIIINYFFSFLQEEMDTIFSLFKSKKRKGKEQSKEKKTKRKEKNIFKKLFLSLEISFTCKDFQQWSCYMKQFFKWILYHKNLLHQEIACDFYVIIYIYKMKNN